MSDYQMNTAEMIAEGQKFGVVKVGKNGLVSRLLVKFEFYVCQMVDGCFYAIGEPMTKEQALKEAAIFETNYLATEEIF